MEGTGKDTDVASSLRDISTSKHETAPLGEVRTTFHDNRASGISESGSRDTASDFCENGDKGSLSSINDRKRRACTVEIGYGSFRFKSASFGPDEKMTPSELDAHPEGVPSWKTGEIKGSTLPGQEQNTRDKNEDVSFVQGFLVSLTGTKLGAAMPRKRNVVLKKEDKRERKRKINRLSAQRKRIRERELMDTLSEQFKQLSSANEALKKESEELRALTEATRNRQSNGNRSFQHQAPVTSLSSLMSDLTQQHASRNTSRAVAGTMQQQLQAFLLLLSISSQTPSTSLLPSVAPVNQLEQLLALALKAADGSHSAPLARQSSPSMQDQRQALISGHNAAHVPSAAPRSIQARDTMIQDLLRVMMNSGQAYEHPATSLPPPLCLDMQSFFQPNGSRQGFSQAATSSSALQDELKSLLKITQVGLESFPQEFPHAPGDFSSSNSFEDQLQSLIYNGQQRTTTPQLFPSETSTTLLQQHLLAKLMSSATVLRTEQVELPSLSLLQNLIPPAPANKQEERLKNLLAVLCNQLQGNNDHGSHPLAKNARTR